MAEGRKKAKPTPYRDGQNVIRDSRSRGIVYMPPEAKDVPLLMKAMVLWIASSERDLLPCPIRAGIAHYQFATIHPYYDGNGRTARLVTTLILHLGGYDLKGLYSLEEYYARSLNRYYDALTIGPSHNYYEGRAKADITTWAEYFCEGATIRLSCAGWTRGSAGLLSYFVTAAESPATTWEDVWYFPASSSQFAERLGGRRIYHRYRSGQENPQVWLELGICSVGGIGSGGGIRARL